MTALKNLICCPVCQVGGAEGGEQTRFVRGFEQVVASFERGVVCYRLGSALRVVVPQRR